MPAVSTKYSREWRKANWRSTEISRLKYVYKVSSEDAAKLIDRAADKCEVCERRDEYRRLNVDHDHKTGRIRGVICHNCNIAIGLLGDAADLAQRLADYLKNASSE